MNFLQAQPLAQFKVNGVVCDYLRQKVLSKMFNFVDGKGIDGHGLGYRFTKADYLHLLYDEVLQQMVCTPNTARRWYREARNGKWKAGVGGGNQVHNLRMTEDVKQCLYDIVLREPFATAEWYAQQLFLESGEMFCSRYINRILSKMKMTTKNVTYERKNKFTELNLEYYHNWVQNYKQVDRRRLVFVDQTGFNRFSFHKKRGRSPAGYRCNGQEQASSRGRRLNCTGMIPWDPSRPQFFYGLTFDMSDYDSWLNFVQAAVQDGFIGPGDILVVDNWSGFVGVNTGQILAEVLAEDLDIHVWPLPKYAPELNPIELLWNFLKTTMQGMAVPQTEQQAFTAVQDLLSSVTYVGHFVARVENYIFTHFN